VQALAQQLLKTIRKQESLRPGDRVAAAVSGGADSVALLHLLLELRAELGIVLSIAHVNHKLRGDESDADQHFVADLAKQHDLEFHLCEAPVDENNPSGIEAAARELRYAFFRRLAAGEASGDVKRTTAKIATAHTLDDQAETVLLRIFRGTGIRGLTGIHPRIVFQDQSGAFGEVMRPLLGIRRAALLRFLQEHGQSWREDSSNRDIAFLRNRVRHRLLPIIAEEFGEAAIEHMAELAELARAEEEHWECGHPEIAAALTEVKKAAPDPEVAISATAEPRHAEPRHTTAEIRSADTGFVSGYRFSDTASLSKSNAPSGAGALPETRQAVSLHVPSLLALPLAAQRRLLRAWLERNAPNLNISFRLIEEALELASESAGRKLEVPGGWNLRRAREELVLESEAGNRHNETTDYEYTLTLPGAVKIPELGAYIEARIIHIDIPADISGVPEDERGQLLNIELIPTQILIRNWRPGDRFWPAYTSAEKKVKELLSDRHATGAQKKLWPVADAEGCGLIWLRGFAVPKAFRAPAGARQAIWIREIASLM
jgi:tRNA(Ile)-lysidine synthase